MARLEAGTVKLCGTDKSYKVYVENDSGADFKQTYRTDDKPYQGHDNPTHDWVTRPMQQHKFYFQHLSVEQRKRFIELWNEKKIKFVEHGEFYVMPFFATRGKSA